MDAVENALTAAGLLDVNRLRHGVEKLPPSSYANFSYYGKWAAASLGVLLEDGVLNQGDVEAALGAEPTSETVLFREGQRVRVKREEAGGLRWYGIHSPSVSANVAQIATSSSSEAPPGF
jgi:nitrile hydratase